MYSARELSELFFGTITDGVFIVIKDIRAYFDASGKEDTSVLTVGGYVTQSHVAAQIENDWNAVLLEFGFQDAEGNPGVFHLNELGNKKCKFGSGEWDISKRVAFLKKLSGVVNRDMNHIFSVSIETAQYAAYLEQSDYRALYGPSYFTGAALHMFGLIEHKLQERGIIDFPIAYIFEKGDREHEMHMCFNWHEKANPVLKDKRTITFQPKATTLLRPTDLIAGKVQEVLTRAHGALKTLDNGMKLTGVHTFEKYFSYDGTTSAILDSKNRHMLLVANKKIFHDVDAGWRAQGIPPGDPNPWRWNPGTSS